MSPSMTCGDLHSAVHAIVEEVCGRTVPVVPLQRAPADSGCDLSCTAALVHARRLGRRPMELAAELARALERGLAGLSTVSPAPPGFVNFAMEPVFWRRAAARMADPDAGDLQYPDLGRQQPVSVEYVSANPTGPLHVAHARGAVIGDVLARVLEALGYRVCREYYVNDAGGQIATLARTVHLRYREAAGHDIGDIPAGLYPGDYLRPVGEALFRAHGTRWLDAAGEEWLAPAGRMATDHMLARIRADLALLAIRHDHFASERALSEGDAMARIMADLTSRDLVYRGIPPAPRGRAPDSGPADAPCELFRASRLGDDEDRVLRRADGSLTYFAGDVLYHADKLRRGFMRQLVVVGADHGGYGKRLQAIVSALSDGKAHIDVRQCGLIRLISGGKPLTMSKRAGQFVTLAELIADIGADAIRFSMLTRKAEAALDFDLDLVRRQHSDNPVFYVQYAHARCCSLLRTAVGHFPDIVATLADRDVSQDTLARDPRERALIISLTRWPQVVAAAGETLEPHRLVHALIEIAREFHILWNAGRDEPQLRCVLPDDSAHTASRLTLAMATRQVIARGLCLLGIEPPESL